jgi:hypothetical protein
VADSAITQNYDHATILALEEGVGPPTVNSLVPDPECSLDTVPNEARTAQIEYALSKLIRVRRPACRPGVLSRLPVTTAGMARV